MGSTNEEKNNQAKKLQKSYFDVLGICCSSEIPLVENILKSLNGVKEFSVIVPSRTVIVIHDSLLISPSQIERALNQARLEANVRINGEISFKNKWPSPFAVVSGVLLLLSFLKYVYPPLRWLAVAAVAAGIFPIVAKAFASIRRFRIDINILVIITVIATIAMQDYTESAAIVFLFTIAEWLESRAGYKASAVMNSLMNLAPQKAVIAESNEEVKVEEVNINTVLAVKAGETIPIDGVVVHGNCEVDEKTLTGEAFPVPKQIDSTVWAGTINLNGYISVKTTALAQDCVVAKMAMLVEEAHNSKTKVQRFIDKCSQYYTPAVVIISTCFAVVPVVLRVHNQRHWFHLALVILVSACPCGLILSTPIATFCALTKAATLGLLIKASDYLETLSKIKIVAFDKTGTITRGEFIVIDFQSLTADISLHSLLYWVSSLESKSSHPMAAALIDYAKSVSIEPKPEALEEYLNFPGEGIYGKIDGKDVYIGNKRIALRAGCSSVPDIEVEKGGKSVGYIYVGERLAGHFSLSDTCRTGVVQAMKEFKSLGVKTIMLTGDNQGAAEHAQEQLGNAMEDVHAELLPQDKARIIKEFKKEGLTAMVGDGLNDAPALATADIGISMGISGSALTTQTGHIILMSNDIRKIPNAIKLARRAHWKVIQNVVLSIVIKGGILVLAFAGHPLIWAAVLADVGTCLLVILNSMLLLREDKTENKCNRPSSSHKLEGNGHKEIERGLIGRSNFGHCNSGCCGKNNQENAMRQRETCSDHCHSGSCQKKLEDNVKLTEALNGKHEGLGDSGCRDNKTQSLYEKSAAHFEGLQVKSCWNGGSSDCCVSKNKKAKENIIISREDQSDLEKGLLILTKGNCKAGCCGSDKQTRENPKPAAEAKTENQDSFLGCCINKSKLDKADCELISCESIEAVEGIDCKPEDSAKPGNTESGLQLEDDKNGRSSCCESKPEMERASDQSCFSKPADLLKNGLQVKNGGHSSRGCCSHGHVGAAGFGSLTEIVIE